MADFLLTEADVDYETIDDEGNNVSLSLCDETVDNDNENDVMNLTDEEFIDDSFVEESISDYYGFTNVSREYNDAIQDSFSDLDSEQNANNYCVNENELYDVETDDFKDSKIKIERFEKSLINPQGFNNKDSFFYSILFAIRHQLTNKFDVVDDEQIKADIGVAIFDEIYLLKNILKLDLNILNFENLCLKINQILNKNKPIFTYL